MCSSDLDAHAQALAREVGAREAILQRLTQQDSQKNTQLHSLNDEISSQMQVIENLEDELRREREKTLLSFIREKIFLKSKK